jgi:hypothetical protein
MPTAEQTRWFHPTPGRFVVALLIIEALLWLSDRFGWWHKGYAVLTGLAGVGVAMLLLLVWLGVALVVRRRFQFSIRSLLVMVVVVALPCSWMTVETQLAKRQTVAVEAIRKLGGQVWYDYEFAKTPAAKHAWLETALGKDFFFSVVDVDVCNTYKLGGTPASIDPKFVTHDISDASLSHLEGMSELRRLRIGGTEVTDVGLIHLAGLTRLGELDLTATKVTDEGVAKLQKALPNGKIIR